MSAACDPKTHRPYTIEQDGFRTIFYSMVGQYGTHVDPPAHFRSDGLTQDQIPLKDMILPLVVFDVTPVLVKEPNHALSVDDVKAWEKEHGRVPAGAFAAIKFLFDERKVTAIGHESLDTDTTEAMESETWILKQNLAISD